MEGGHGEVEDWPLLFAVKARGKKKKWGRKKEKERKSQPYELRFPTKLHCAPTVGEQAQHGEARHPPSCHLSAVIGDGNAELRQRTASLQRAGRGRGTRLQRSTAGLLHSSSSGESPPFITTSDGILRRNVEWHVSGVCIDS